MNFQRQQTVSRSVSELARVQAEAEAEEYKEQEAIERLHQTRSYQQAVYRDLGIQEDPSNNRYMRRGTRPSRISLSREPLTVNTSTTSLQKIMKTQDEDA